MPAALRVRFLRTACSACWRLGLAWLVAWLVASRDGVSGAGREPSAVVGAKASSRSGRGVQRSLCSDNYRAYAHRAKCATRQLRITENDFPFKTRLAARRLPLAARRSHSPLAGSHSPSPVPTRRHPGLPLALFTWRLGTRLGRLGPFSKGHSALHTGDTARRGRLAEPTARQGRQLAGASRPTGGGDSLAPLGPSPFARRPRRARLAPATCARRGRLALAPLSRAPPLPPRFLPTTRVRGGRGSSFQETASFSSFFSVGI